MLHSHPKRSKEEEEEKKESVAYVLYSCALVFNVSISLQTDSMVTLSGAEPAKIGLPRLAYVSMYAMVELIRLQQVVKRGENCLEASLRNEVGKIPFIL